MRTQDQMIAPMPTVVFLHPPWSGLPSGGHKFNRRLVANAQRHQFPLQSVNAEMGSAVAAAVRAAGSAAEPTTTEAGRPLLLWDSLLMRCHQAAARDGARRTEAFLMHYLPSLDPSLDGQGRSAARRLEDGIAARVSFFLTTGHGLAAVLRRRYPRIPAFVCEPGVDRVFTRVRRGPRQAGDSSVNLLSVAHLVAAKGYGELLSVVHRLQGRRWFWHIVGSRAADAEFAREFEHRARRLIDSGRIMFHGILSSADLARLMASMDLFMCASRFESYGMAMTEAVAAGLPVVTTDVGVASRIAAEAEHVRVVPVGDPDAFLGALTGLFDVTGCDRDGLRQRVRVRGWDDAFADFATACRTGTTRRCR